MTKQEALRYFRKNVLPYIRSKDRTAIREAWNNLMDSMYHDGQISERSYQTWVGPPEGNSQVKKSRRNPGRDLQSNINPGCPVGTQVQTLVLSKTFFNQREAKNWIGRHDFRISKIDETTNSWRFRQQPPEWFEKRSFRTIRLRPGVQAVIGCPLD